MRFLLPVIFFLLNIKMSSEFDVTAFVHETPKVIKNLTKEFSLEKSIAIDELKVALKKASRELYPGEMVDVLEEFIDGLKLDEDTMKYENFRVLKEDEKLVGQKVEEAVKPVEPTVLVL